MIFNNININKKLDKVNQLYKLSIFVISFNLYIYFNCFKDY